MLYQKIIIYIVRYLLSNFQPKTKYKSKKETQVCLNTDFIIASSYYYIESKISKRIHMLKC